MKVSIHEHTLIKVFERIAGFSYISGYQYYNVSKQLYHLKNKAVINLKQYCMYCYLWHLEQIFLW